MKFKQLLLLVISTALICTAGAAELRNKYLALNFSENGSFKVKNLATDEVFNVRGRFTLYDGSKKAWMKLPAPVITQNGQQSVIKYKTAGFEWNITIKPHGKIMLIDAVLKNISSRELLLEPGIKLYFSGVKNIKKCWAGFGYTDAFGKKKIIRKGIKGKVEKHTSASTRPFPVVAVFGKKSALFAGGVPFDPISYTACFIDKPKADKSSMGYSVRTAILPKTENKTRFTVGIVRNNFGNKEAVVQAYYDSLPQLWAPVVGQDSPYIWGAHAMYLSWWWKPEAELLRRLYVVNEWTYCPYKRSGDIAARKELWNYRPKNRYKKKYSISGTNFNFKNITRKEYIALRRKQFREYGKEFGLMFFNSVSGSWCEVNLAREKYPDAIVHDKSVPLYLKQWSTHHDHEVRTFQMGTSFAKVFRQDMVDMVKDLDLPGFAFDCSYSGAYYRGPAVKKNLPGRAWDDKGVFIDQGVAINNLADFTHNIIKTKNPAEKMAIFANGYLKADYMMVEASYMEIGKFKQWMPLLRYHIGPRPGAVHKHGYNLRNVITTWREKTPADFKKFMPKLADYTIFSQFKYGLTATYLSMYGTPQVLYVMPEVIEMMRAGWQVEVPVSFDSKGSTVIQARYGKAENSYIFLGNPYNYDITMDVAVGNKFLGDKDYLFVRKMRRSATMDNIVDNNETTMNVKLKSRVPFLYEAVCGIDQPNGKSAFSVSSLKDLDQQVYAVKMTGGKPFNTTVVLRKIRNFVLAQVKLNGKAVKFSDAKGAYRTAMVNLKSNSDLKFVYKSTIFKLNEKNLLGFGFVDKNKNVAFKIAVSVNATKQELQAADNIVKYFKFCAQKKVINSKSPVVKISKLNRIPATGNWLVIGSRDHGASVLLTNGRILEIKSADPEQTVKLVQYVMDKKFEYIFPFKNVMGLYTKQLQHFKMLGKYLPYSKYFETDK
ncbi:MAG: hypothetical protein L3J71_18085 [Victivallaceae bacterium]|nr:hypothetical protein [Victivallaceae bacterium]